MWKSPTLMQKILPVGVSGEFCNSVFGPESQNFASKSIFVIIKVANKSYSHSDSSWGIRHNSKKSREIPIWVEGEQSLIKNPGRH